MAVESPLGASHRKQFWKVPRTATCLTPSDAAMQLLAWDTDCTRSPEPQWPGHACQQAGGQQFHFKETSQQCRCKQLAGSKMHHLWYFQLEGSRPSLQGRVSGGRSNLHGTTVRQEAGGHESMSQPKRLVSVQRQPVSPKCSELLLSNYADFQKWRHAPACVREGEPSGASIISVHR